MALSEEKQKALESALKMVEKSYGKGAAMRLSEQSAMKVQTFSTGSLAVDAATGIGGFPRGRIVEIYGPESSGKTTMTLHAIASAQKSGGSAVFIDAEHALDPTYARALGVDTDNLIVSQPDYGEQALEIAETFINSGAVDLVVVDSVAALVPKSELEGDMGQSSMGVQARLMSQALRKIASSVNRTKTTVIFINQIREKIGVMFGSPETTTGGRALKFYASIRIDIRRIESLKEGTNIVGNRTRVKIVKNKLAPPFKEALTDIMYGKGFSREGDIIDMGIEHNVIRKSGSWFSRENGDQLGQGRERVRQALLDSPELADELEREVLVRIGIISDGEETENEVVEG